MTFHLETLYYEWYSLMKNLLKTIFYKIFKKNPYRHRICTIHPRFYKKTGLNRANSVATRILLKILIKKSLGELDILY